MTDPGDVPLDILRRLRPICLGLPETYEEPAWVGIRWRIRQRTFAHVYAARSDHPMAYAVTAAADSPVYVMTFRSPGGEIEALVRGGYPFYKPDWGPDVVGIVLGADGDGVDWEEIGELLTESYCVQAPKRLAAKVDRPPDA